MNLHFKARSVENGFSIVASPQNSPLRWQSFGLLNLLGKGKSYEGNLGEEEAVLTLLSGQGTIEIQERSGATTRYELGPRQDPFLDRATLVYLPPGAAFKVTSALSEFQSALHRAPASQEGAAFLIKPDKLTPISTGVSNWRRDVCVCTPNELPVQRFIIGETINPPGNWSSYPPHKHDEKNPPAEYPLEEIYYFLLNPGQGFGMMRVYDPPKRKNRLEEAFVIQNGDTVVIPHGYHPVVVAPGYQLYYLFALAGKERHHGTWIDDPAHQWVRESRS